jgi:hypothetical protein
MEGGNIHMGKFEMFSKAMTFVNDGRKLVVKVAVDIKDAPFTATVVEVVKGGVIAVVDTVGQVFNKK